MNNERNELEQLYWHDSAINNLKSLKSDLSEPLIASQIAETMELLVKGRIRITGQYPGGKYTIK